ncbi:MAG TPA: glycoside hydrolase domain-containing protein [Acetobacteraceae bacterium]|nr:glycoside hydrolase domain-containing protein [Acetobacteraceae bacterium]
MAGHAGFDCSEYPGDSIMDWFKANTNLVWCGYYFGPTPSHDGTSWLGKRAKLVADGWGIAPLYVGEQVIPPGSENPSAAKGTADGQDAVQFMANEGFQPGSCVYLDLEDGSLPPPLEEYTASWIEAVAAGGFQPGVYCSHVIANKVSALAPNVRIWAFKVPTTASHHSPGPPFREDDPASSGFANAVAWQLDQNATIDVTPAPGGQFKPIDLDSARVSDPGAPALVA